jgi:type I restriction enzyme S subunit
MSEEKLVPKLRFDGFNKVWESKQIGEIAEVVGGGTPKTEIVDYWDGEIKWFTPSEIGKTKYVFDSDRHITEKGLKNSSAKLLPKDALLLSSRATVGEISIALTECSTNQGFQSLITKSNVDNDFIYYLISTIKNEFLRRSSGSTFLEINKNEIKRMPINIPELSEQKKISNLFSAIDNKIEMLEKKCEYYQDFKKYLMQRIFSSSDDKLRFKSADGEQYSDWKERNLYEFLTEHKLKSTGNEEVYSVSVHKGLVNQKEHLGRDFSAPDTSKYNLVKPGDIVYTKSPTGDFPLGIIKQSRVDKNVIVSPLYGVFTPETYALGYILNDYFESNVNTHNYLHPIVQKGAKNTMNITNKTFLSKTLFVPTDVNEQQKIAECFSKVNDSIRNIEIQQNKVNEFKKGLLQQMFV